MHGFKLPSIGNRDFGRNMVFRVFETAIAVAATTAICVCVCVCCVLLLPLVIIIFYYDLSIAIELLIDWCNAMFQMTFGEQNNEKESHDILNYAFEHGINALDTAEAVSYFFQSYLNLRFASFLLISPLVVS